MNNPFLICLDLDGTLLNEKSEVSQRNKRALKSCLDRGGAVCVVTGRPYCFAKYTALSVDPRIRVISSAGACYERDGELIVSPVPQKALQAFVDCLEKSEARAFFKGLHTFYTHEAYDKRFLYDRFNPLFPPDGQVRSLVELSYQELREKARDIHKILVYAETGELMEAFESQVSDISGLQVSRYNDISIDVSAAGVDKGRAIRDIRLRLGISKKATLAIGDAKNDLPMFQEAGVKIAMANAKEEIREMCDWVTASNEEDGVALVLENLENYLKGSSGE